MPVFCSWAKYLPRVLIEMMYLLQHVTVSKQPNVKNGGKLYSIYAGPCTLRDYIKAENLTSSFAKIVLLKKKKKRRKKDASEHGLLFYP